MVLGSAYPRWEAGEGTWLVFAKVLEDYDPDCILAACWTWVRNEKFPPSPAELRATVDPWSRFLNEGPEIELVRLRLDYDHALGPAELEAAKDSEQRIADAVQQQTGKSIEQHLEEWRKQAARHKEERRQIVQAHANGGRHESVPERMLLTAATTSLPEDET
jgi:hypothetical protein